MYSRHKQTLKHGYALFRLWLNWVLGIGTLAVLVIASLVVPAIYMPFMAFGLEFLLFLIIRSSRTNESSICSVIPFVASRIMFWSAITMIVINLMYSRWLVHVVFNEDTINTEIPFIAQLIIGPITFVVSTWAYIRGTNIGHCRYCTMHFGNSAESGFLKRMFSDESHYQMKLLMILSAICTIVSIFYYFFVYNNINLSHSDKFTFFWLPIILYVVASVYLAVRLLSLWSYYEQNIPGSDLRNQSSTMLRFIMVWSDYICVVPPNENPDIFISNQTRYDIPGTVSIHYHDSITPDEMDRLSTNICGFTPHDVRFMYSTANVNNNSNIIHFLCFFNDEEKEDYTSRHPNCEWLTIAEISNLINTYKASPMLRSEIIRLYTVAMAWKCYERNGKRKFKIKNYRPKFRVCDMKRWDVDYNDSKWLFVANNNEDKPFFRIKRFWRRFINGVGD